MRLPVLALFARALRAESRAASTYVARVGLATIVFFALVRAHQAAPKAAAVGLGFFAALAELNLVFITGIGLLHFSSAITEEKEAEMLPLLKMVGFASVGLLLGKSTSRLLGVLMLLLTQVPFTLLAVTLGGVSPNQVACVYAAMLAYTVLLANVSLFASVAMPRTRQATTLSCVLAGLLLFAGPLSRLVLPVLRAIAPTSSGGWVARAGEGLAQVAVGLNPFVRVRKVLSTGFAGPPLGPQAAGSLLLGALLFMLSWAVFERFTREHRGAAAGRGLLPRRSSVLRCLGVGRTWRLAITWKDFHFLTGGRPACVVRLGVVAAAVFVSLRLGWGCSAASAGVGRVGSRLMLVSVIGACLEALHHAGSMFRQEVRWGTMGPLMALPRSTAEIIGAKFAGVLPALVPFAGAFLLGAVLNPSCLHRTVARLFGHAIGWFALVQIIALLYLVAMGRLQPSRLERFILYGAWLMANVLADLSVIVLWQEDGFVPVAGAVGVGMIAMVGAFHTSLVERVEELAGQ